MDKKIYIGTVALDDEGNATIELEQPASIVSEAKRPAAAPEAA